MKEDIKVLRRAVRQCILSFIAQKINTIKPSDVDESSRKCYFHHLITVKSIIIERIIHHLRQEKCSQECLLLLKRFRRKKERSYHSVIACFNSQFFNGMSPLQYRIKLNMQKSFKASFLFEFLINLRSIMCPFIQNIDLPISEQQNSYIFIYSEAPFNTIIHFNKRISKRKL